METPPFAGKMRPRRMGHPGLFAPASYSVHSGGCVAGGVAAGVVVVVAGGGCVAGGGVVGVVVVDGVVAGAVLGVETAPRDVSGDVVTVPLTLPDTPPGKLPLVVAGEAPELTSRAMASPLTTISTRRF